MKRLPQTAFITLVLLCHVVGAQSLSLDERRIQPNSTGLALEVTYWKGGPPAYSSVLGPPNKPGGAWYALFDRIQSGEVSARSLPVRAVDVRSIMEDGFVRVIVSVFVGNRLHEKKEPVAVYNLRENEAVTTEALTEFGVKPFVIKVIRVNPSLVDAPAVTTDTQSLAFVGIEPQNTTLPSFKLTFQNTSHKDVMAVSLNVLANGKVRGSSLPHGLEGRPLIPAGGLGEVRVGGFYSAQKTPHGYQPQSPPNLEVVVTSAVFGDGSFEGDPKMAATFIAFGVGRKMQIAKLIELIELNANSPYVDLTSALEALKAQAASLGTDAQSSELSVLRESFPQLTTTERENLKISVDVTLQSMKSDFLKRIEDFEKNNAQASEEQFRTWLKLGKLGYQHWLARLTNEKRL